MAAATTPTGRRYFDYDGVRAYEDPGQLPVRCPPGGEESIIYDGDRWAHNAQEITKAEYDAWPEARSDAGAGPDRIFVHPDELKTKEAQDAFAESIADDAIAAIEAKRKAKGLAPMSE